MRWALAKEIVPWTLTQEQLYMYVVYRLNEDCCVQTVKGNLSAVRKFHGLFGWPTPSNDKVMKFMFD
jgi:hypothetical protein